MIPRHVLESVFPGNIRAIQEFEAQSEQIGELDVARQSQAEMTNTALEATYLTASANAQLPRERVFRVGLGLSVADDGNVFRVSLTNEVPKASGGFSITFSSTADANIVVPPAGVMATLRNIETLENKTLAAPKLSGLGNHVNDAAASAGGVPIGGIYRNGSILMVRVA